MTGGTAPKGGSGNLRRLNPNIRPRRCLTCGAFLSPLCEICRGVPYPDVTIEQIARGCAQVDRATRSRQGQ
jgi:hypothetical protein